MLKKYFILGASALLALSNYSYADESNGNDTKEEGTESYFLVDNETDNDTKQDANDSQDSGKEALYANDNESSEQNDNDSKDEQDKIAADEGNNESSDSSDEKEETKLAACGGGKCPAQMIEKLRQEKQQSQEEDSKA